MGDNIPQVECVKCKVMMPVTAIKQHMLVCPAHDLHDIPLEVPSTSSQVQFSCYTMCFVWKNVGVLKIVTYST